MNQANLKNQTAKVAQAPAPALAQSIQIKVARVTAITNRLLKLINSFIQTYLRFICLTPFYRMLKNLSTVKKKQVINCFLKSSIKKKLSS